MDLPAQAPPQREATVVKFSFVRAIYQIPWWFVLLSLLGIYVAGLVYSNPLYSSIFNQLRSGIAMTLTVSFTAFSSALVVGLIIGIIRANPPKQRYGSFGAILGFIQLFLYNAATLYVQILRGLPILVTLLIVAFVIVPEVNRISRDVFDINLGLRGSSPTSAIIALTFTYGAFLSETFRAGIQSISKGQIEAARSLGMNYSQVMR